MTRPMAAAPGASLLVGACPLAPEPLTQPATVPAPTPTRTGRPAVPAQPLPPDERCCARCGAPFDAVAGNGWPSRRRYCGDACRKAAHRDRHRKPRETACKHCSRPLPDEGVRPGRPRLFCGQVCRVAAERAAVRDLIATYARLSAGPRPDLGGTEDPHPSMVRLRRMMTDLDRMDVASYARIARGRVRSSGGHSHRPQDRGHLGIGAARRALAAEVAEGSALRQRYADEVAEQRYREERRPVERAYWEACSQVRALKTLLAQAERDADAAERAVFGA